MTPLLLALGVPFTVGGLHAQTNVELHLYAQGGHAFGLRRTAHPITRWPGLVETWLHTIGMTSEHPEVRRLIAAFSSDQWRERAHAVESLSRLGLKARSAIGHLIQRLSDEERQVRRAAAVAIEKIAEQPTH